MHWGWAWGSEPATLAEGPCPQFRAPSPSGSPKGLPRWPLNHCQLIKEVKQLRGAHAGLSGTGAGGACPEPAPGPSRARPAQASLCPPGGPGRPGRGGRAGGEPAVGRCPFPSRAVCRRCWHHLMRLRGCQAALEQLKQALGEVSFVGWAESVARCHVGAPRGAGVGGALPACLPACIRPSALMDGRVAAEETWEGTVR